MSIQDSREQRASTYRAQMAHDMRIVLASHGITHCAADPEQLLDELVECGMFRVEHLLYEVTRVRS